MLVLLVGEVYEQSANGGIQLTQDAALPSRAPISVGAASAKLSNGARPQAMVKSCIFVSGQVFVSGRLSWSTVRLPGRRVHGNGPT